MVNMKEKPFHLTEEDCKWVEDVIAGMTVDEKIGQLFFNMGASREEAYLKMTVNDYHIGGIRYNPGTAEEVYEQNRILQENSKIPLIIACNTENGGDMCRRNFHCKPDEDRRNGKYGLCLPAWIYGEQRGGRHRLQSFICPSQRHYV